jgi:hypothetical protein
MAKLKPRLPVPVSWSADESEVDPDGPRPGRDNPEADRRWLAVRRAKFSRAIGGPNDPRHLLRQGARRR